MDIYAIVRQYEEGAITFAELILWLAHDYNVKQSALRDSPAPTCLSCGSDLSARLA